MAPSKKSDAKTIPVKQTGSPIRRKSDQRATLVGLTDPDDAALSRAGIGPGTIRLSIGLEDADDLIDDLKRALKVAQNAAGRAA